MDENLQSMRLLNLSQSTLNNILHSVISFTVPYDTGHKILTFLIYCNPQLHPSEPQLWLLSPLCSSGNPRSGI